MRLNGVLSKPPKQDYVQIEGFLTDKKGNIGQQVELSIGKIALNYYCSNCEDIRTFYSKDKLCCIFVNTHIISIDCVLSCCCNVNVQVWFLIEAENDIRNQSPNVRILKRSENLPNIVRYNSMKYGVFTDLLEKAERAYRDDLGAGAIVYLRKIFEIITKQTATAENIAYTTDKGKRKTFKNLLTEVDAQCKIIPTEFSENSYKLFGELSDVVHGDYDEELGLQKFESFYRLVIGILDNINNKTELCAAIQALGWNEDTGGTP